MKYKKIKYPDGQVSVKVTDWGLEGEPIFITERINSYEDLFFIMSLAEVIKHMNSTNYHLVITCLFGQRSDRRFEPSQSLDLKVICDCINSCGFKTVQIYDPHSDVPIMYIQGARKISTDTFVKLSLDNIKDENVVLVSPDAGAYKKVFSYGELFQLPVVAAVKHRDKEGTINLQMIGDVKDKTCLIVDDLLDGGYTFHVLAEKLKQQGAKKVYLYVTHAYFNKGIDFTEHIDHFYCTNSVKEITHDKVTQFKII